ncbi:arylsulfatase A-like enzyme [Dyadobacter jejuensis]|uniref:Arylsulfatase A-like enzyme n=2 Tax=Dyadobacter jejuensis TaxID=1082580 RepID=A0A316B5P9_9BACT|nr:arylsulfatase A-like enzyme [Dyadobacter jejuensis]
MNFLVRMKLIHLKSLLVGLFIVSCPAFIHAEKRPKKPNIIFILVDDLGYADVGFNGSKWFETPAMDALARQSLVLDNAYMYPTCSPSRTAFFTGKQSFRTGVYTVPVLETGTDQENIFSRWTVEKKHTLFSVPLAEAGYQAIHLGKWHIVGPDPLHELQLEFPLKEKLTQPQPGDFSWVAAHKSKAIQEYYPQGRGFVKNVGGTYRGDPALEAGGYKSETMGYHAPFSNPFIEPKPTDSWLTDRLTDEALEFMEQYKDSSFFVNLHYYAVHRPITSRSQTLMDKYMGKEGDAVTGQGLGPRRKEMAAYATMVESVDQNLQRILDFLDAEGLRQNSVIILTSDNGYNGGQSSNDLMRGSKGYIYEGGIRVPALINWPGQVEPRRSQVPITVFDYYPTFLDLAGVDNYTGQLDGHSLTSLFKKDDRKLQKRNIYWHLASQYKHGTCSVIRSGPYKLIQFLASGELELYDLAQDPLESDNLVTKEPLLTKRLLADLVHWRQSNAVPLPPNAALKY